MCVEETDTKNQGWPLTAMVRHGQLFYQKQGRASDFFFLEDYQQMIFFSVTNMYKKKKVKKKNSISNQYVTLFGKSLSSWTFCIFMCG